MRGFQWTEKQHRRWETERKDGPFLWILRNGVMTWGTSMFVMMTIFRAWFYGKHTVSRDELIGSAGLYAIAGALFGLVLWVWSERSYKRALEREDTLP
jgi:hypothetical protein